MAVFAQTFPRRTATNGAAIFGGEAFSRLATFTMAVIVAHRFGAPALGQYGYALALANILLLVPDLGLHLIATRELAAEPGRLRAIFWSVHWLKLILVGGVVAFTLLFGQAAIQDEGRRLLFYLLAIRAVLQTFSQAYMAIFKAFERMQYIALQQLVNAFLLVAWASSAVWAGAGLGGVICALIAGQAAEAWLGWRIIQTRFSTGPVYSWDGRLLAALFLGSLPVGITAILQTLNLRLDILVLSLYASNRELGSFQAAAWFQIGAYLVASLVMAVLFPRMSRLLRAPSRQAQAYVRDLLKNGALLVTTGSLGVWLGAPALLHVIFGTDLGPAVGPLRILTAALPLMFLNTILFYIFVAAQRREAYLSALTIGVTLGCVLSFALASRFGARGSALADFGRELAVSLVYLAHILRSNLWRGAGRALLRVFFTASAAVLVLAAAASLQIIAAAWPAAWNLALLVGALFSLGPPRIREWLLITDDRL
jgi:O-antigen/teichoic acid export membrane protein